MKELTPERIVKELNKYIIGQDKAKKAVAIAIRNRWRRQQITGEMKEDVTPKNILMIGKTGVGKTEIARRLASLVRAPFIKVEASKYTEVGYHGRDVESMIRDLVKLAVNMVEIEAMAKVRKTAEQAAEEKLLDLLLPELPSLAEETDAAAREKAHKKTREKMRAKLRNGELDGRTVEMTVEGTQMPVAGVLTNMGGGDDFGIELQEMLEKMMPKRNVAKKTSVAEARRITTEAEAGKLIDKEKVIREALGRAETSGIIFIDELDKVIGTDTKHGPDVSREGVQRDLLPVVEGTSVATKYGFVKTDHILVIAAGAFHAAKPSDLLPEMQGRFPIRVELDDLGKDEFIQILTKPKNALTKQYEALMATEGITIAFEKRAVERIGEIAADVNRRTQNIGARRLQTIMEKLLEDISFKAPKLKEKNVAVTVGYVNDKLADIVKDEDLTKYIL